MKRYRATVFITIAALITVLLTTVAYAHPGNTDSKGGHRVSDTGEYHYHHGYSAHRHYDADGDGDIDCPYDFKDKTGINSGSTGNRNDEDDLLSTLIFVSIIIGGFVIVFFYDNIKEIVAPKFIMFKTFVGKILPYIFIAFAAIFMVVVALEFIGISVVPLSKGAEVILSGVSGSIFCSFFLGIGFVAGSEESLSEKIRAVLFCALFGFFLGLVFYFLDGITLRLAEKIIGH